MNKIFKEDESEKKVSSSTELEKDSLFLSVFDNNQAIILLVDPSNHQIIDANGAAENFYGYTRDKLLTMNMRQINIMLSEERHLRLEDAIDKHYGFTRFVHKINSGILKNVEVYISKIVYNRKNVMFIIVHDITELKKSNEQLELAMAGSNLGLWDWCIQTGDLQINERWAAMLGYTLEEILPVTNDIWRGLCHPDDLSVVDSQFQKYLRKEIDIYKADFRMKHKNGSWVWIQTYGKVFEWTEDGKPLRVAGTHLDISEKKKAALELADSEAKFRSYFESSPLSLWEQDYSQIILYLKKLKFNDNTDIEEYLDNNPEILKNCSRMLRTINVNYATLLLYESKDKEGLLLNYERIDTQISYEIFKKKIISIYRNEVSFNVETEHVTFKGKKINIRLESILLANYKVLLTITDITELKSKELELKELLSQTKADAETKEILLREINHRVKNNLSSFIGMLYAEKKQSGSIFDTIQKEHVDSLINRVKGISIAHELLSRSQWAPILISKLTEKIIHSLNHLIPKDREIRTIIKPSNIFLDADQSHSAAIIINELFSNSIKHAIGPGEKIEVEIDIQEKNGTIIFIYNDSGSGYPEEILKSEFKNVGMYLIKNIVEQSLRGSMKMENRDGARIEIEFPGGIKLEEL